MCFSTIDAVQAGHSGQRHARPGAAAEVAGALLLLLLLLLLPSFVSQWGGRLLHVRPSLPPSCLHRWTAAKHMLMSPHSPVLPPGRSWCQPSFITWHPLVPCCLLSWQPRGTCLPRWRALRCWCGKPGRCREQPGWGQAGLCRAWSAHTVCVQQSQLAAEQASGQPTFCLPLPPHPTLASQVSDTDPASPFIVTDKQGRQGRLVTGPAESALEACGVAVYVIDAVSCAWEPPAVGGWGLGVARRVA